MRRDFLKLLRSKGLLMAGLVLPNNYLTSVVSQSIPAWITCDGVGDINLRVRGSPSVSTNSSSGINDYRLPVTSGGDDQS